MNNESIQSTTVVAGSPGGVLEPVAPIWEKRGSVRRVLSIALYICKCVKCKETTVVVEDALRELGAEKAIQVLKRSWQLWWFFPLLKGAWHPPILEIAGKVYSEGVVPPKEELKRYIQSLLI